YRSSSSIGVGVLAGAMTISLSMPGPTLFLYLTAIGADKDTLRAISLTFFAVAYAAALLLQTLAFGIEGEVWMMAVVLVPVAAVGAQLGHWLSQRVTESTFRRAVLLLLGATGVYTLLTTLIA
ncbi:MAG: TSUP family transporter, partial [Gemmatimonadetes bacterium]|nr:TSUP family transporter [Gemmatimonadota bacterium]